MDMPSSSTQAASSNIVLPPITAFDHPSRDAPVHHLHRPPPHYQYYPYAAQIPSTVSIDPRAAYPTVPIAYQPNRNIWPSQQYSLPQQARALPQDHNLLLAQQPGDRGNFKEVKRRTKTGCQTCRKRRIKCDEARPSCRNCIKSKRVCLGYDPAHQPAQNHSPLLQHIPRSHPNDPNSISPSTSQSESYMFHRRGSISSRTSSLNTDPEHQHHSDTILPPLRNLSPNRMDDSTSAYQEYPNRTLPPPDQSIRRAKRCTIDELCTIEGTQRPNLPPLPNTPPNLDAIKAIFDTTFASGLDKLLETNWFSKHAFQYLVNDLAFLAQILAYITMIHDRHQFGEEVKLRSQEARITWALLGLCVRPQPRTNHLRCLTGRLHAISVMLTGEGVPAGSSVVIEDGDDIDIVDDASIPPLSALQRKERERQHDFWRAVGRVVTSSWDHMTRSQKSAEEAEAMDLEAKKALDDCRARLDNRENRDLVYSILLMRHMSEKWAKPDDGGQDVSMEGTADSSPVGSIPSEVIAQWNVAKRFVELEAKGRSTTLVLSVLASMAGRVWI